PATVAVSGLLGQEEVVAGLSLGGQCGGDVLEGYVVLVGVLLDQSAEESDLGVLECLGDGVGELDLAVLVDLVHGRQFHLHQWGVGGPLDGAEHTTLTWGDEQDGLAGTSCTAGAANAVDVGL